MARSRSTPTPRVPPPAAPPEPDRLLHPLTFFVTAHERRRVLRALRRRHRDRVRALRIALGLPDPDEPGAPRESEEASR